MRRTRWLVAVTWYAGAAHAVAAQTTLLHSVGWSASPTASVWHFATPLPQSGGDLADVAETAMPFRVRFIRNNWSADLTGAAAFGAVRFTTSSGDGRLLTIAGPTDIKLRVSGPLLSDLTLLTVGVNVPTGKSNLNSEETSVLQVLAAPALQMPTVSFGIGLGVTVGLLRAFKGDGWAVAIGASGERRSEYSPVALALSSGTSETKLTPGLAAHVTVGLDRTMGQGRLSMLLVGDAYSEDKVRIGGLPAADSSNDYTLGPQLSGTMQYEFGAAGWRESSISVGARARTQYADAVGAKVAGSSGTYFEGALNAVRGGPEGAGLIIGTDARWHSGLSFTEAMVGAAVSAVGITLGVDRAGHSTSTRFVVRGSYGTFDTGASRSAGMGLTVGFSIGARREAQ